MRDQTPSPPRIRILRMRAVVERLGISPTTIWRLRQRNRFPPPVKLSAQAIGWYEHDIDRWASSRSVVAR